MVLNVHKPTEDKSHYTKDSSMGTSQRIPSIFENFVTTFNCKGNEKKYFQTKKKSGMRIYVKLLIIMGLE
jgi:hypothetical protein